MGAFPKLLESPVSNLTNPFTGDAKEGSDLFQSSFFPVVQPIVQVEDLSLPLREVFLEHVLEVVTACDGLYVFLDVTSFGP